MICIFPFNDTSQYHCSLHRELGDVCSKYWLTSSQFMAVLCCAMLSQLIWYHILYCPVPALTWLNPTRLVKILDLLVFNDFMREETISWVVVVLQCSYMLWWNTRTGWSGSIFQKNCSKNQILLFVRIRSSFSTVPYMAGIFNQNVRELL